MRFALFTDTFTPQINGVARTYQRLIAYLESKNVETRVFAPAGGLPENETENPSVVRFFSCDFFLYPDCQFSLPNYFSAHHILSEFQPDLIHLATPFMMGLTGLKYANDHHIPKVAVFHTNFPQYLEYYRLPWLKKLAWRFLRWFHQQAEKNYCPSQDTRKLLRRHGVNKLEIWTRGVDSGLFNPNRKSLEFRRQLGLEDKTVLLYVGRLAPEKSVEVLLKALYAANSANKKLHLLIAGDGPSRAGLQQAAPPNVTFLGYKSGQELAGIYATSDIFVCPSVTETFGNVILEAMASGLPVIAPLSGGIKENLFPAKNGLSCLPLNPLSMSGAILEMAADTMLRQQLADQAYAHAKRQSWDEVFYRLLSSYLEVVEAYNFRKKMFQAI